MRTALEKIFNLMKSDQSIKREVGLLAIEKWIEKNKDITTLYLQHTNLGALTINIWEHLRKLTHLTDLNLGDNNLRADAVNACENLKNYFFHTQETFL